MLHKVLRSAIANATENDGLGIETLIISKIQVDEGPTMRRMRARAMGRGNVIDKRSSHITVVLREGDPFELPKSNAKPKPRPKFESAKVKKSVTKVEADTTEVASSAEPIETQGNAVEAVEESGASEPEANNVPETESKGDEE
jgi:large subunit ribosomal protein L22